MLYQSTSLLAERLLRQTGHGLQEKTLRTDELKWVVGETVACSMVLVLSCTVSDSQI